MVTAGTGVDWGYAIKEAIRDKQIFATAKDLWRAGSPALFDDRLRLDPHGLRISDAGRCVRELNGELYGRFDIPENYDQIDSRMQSGILDGGKAACLAAAFVKHRLWPMTAVLEAYAEFCGIPGHADLAILIEPDEYVEVVEFKESQFPKAADVPRDYYMLQACAYALALKAPAFAVVVHTPAAFKAPRRRCFRAMTEHWADRTAADYTRLVRAQEEAIPEPDVRDDEGWRCEYCRLSQCGLNKNPLNPRQIVDVVVDEVGVL